MADDDFLEFEEDHSGSETAPREPEGWQVLVVDDEPEVHRVTRLALDGFTFADKPLLFLNAYSAAEAMEILKDNTTIAMILLDVVMETEHAGLDLARWVREDLKNHFVRIILRTGQPGQAPETEVIANYDINDYKEKTELTSRKLFTLMYSTLRSYRDIVAINTNRQGLEKIIEATATLFELQSLQKFTRGALEQLSAILHINEGAFYGIDDGLAVTADGDRIIIQAGTGKFETYVGQSLSAAVPEDLCQDLIDHMREGQIDLREHDYIGTYVSRTGSRNLLYLSGLENISTVDKDLVRIFGQNLAVAFDNLYLLQRFRENEQTMMHEVGDLVGSRSGDIENHQDRVAEISRFLARKQGLDTKTVNVIYKAAPFHDIGMVGVPDSILTKAEKLTDDERKLVQKHTETGHHILSQSNQDVFQAAAIIARDHHERWDGQGYPQGKRGEDIHTYARIVAVADVFDALLCARSYKKAWPIEDIKDYFRQQRGKQFDPNLTDILLVHAEELAALNPVEN